MDKKLALKQLVWYNFNYTTLLNSIFFSLIYLNLNKIIQIIYFKLFYLQVNYFLLSNRLAAYIFYTEKNKNCYLPSTDYINIHHIVKSYDTMDKRDFSINSDCLVLFIIINEVD